MVTDHLMVTHYRSERGVLVANSFVGVTEVLAHSSSTTHIPANAHEYSSVSVSVNTDPQNTLTITGLLL